MIRFLGLMGLALSVATTALADPSNTLGRQIPGFKLQDYRGKEHSLEDLRDRPQARLAVIRGSVEESQARAAGIDDTRLLKVPDVQSGIAAVRSNRAAGFALSAPSLRWAMRVSGAPGGELADPFQAPAMAGAAGLPAYAMRLGDERLPRLDAALAGFLGSPAHQRLAQAYGFQPDELPVVPARAPAPSAQEGHP